MTSTTNVPHTTQESLAGSDKILVETKVAAAIIILFLAVGFVILFFFPERTDTLFAWTIRPNMTPLMMGAGYVSGLYFFARLILSTKWHWFTGGFLPIAVFAWFMLLATLLHWDRFHHGHISFYAWTGVYALTPFLVPYIWYHNRKADPGTPDPHDVVIPLRLRQFFLVTGAAEVTLALFMFLLPEVAMRVAPWTMTPLTSRVLGGWFALHGMLGLLLYPETRWSAARISVQTQLIPFVLILVASFRAWEDFNKANFFTWAFLFTIVFLLVVLIAIYVRMEARRKTTGPIAQG
jgi:hypothetical protein